MALVCAFPSENIIQYHTYYILVFFHIIRVRLAPSDLQQLLQRWTSVPLWWVGNHPFTASNLAHIDTLDPHVPYPKWEGQAKISPLCYLFIEQWDISLVWVMRLYECCGFWGRQSVQSLPRGWSWIVSNPVVARAQHLKGAKAALAINDRHGSLKCSLGILNRIPNRFKASRLNFMRPKTNEAMNIQG